jgi:hypothetical protein
MGAFVTGRRTFDERLRSVLAARGQGFAGT